MANEQSSNILSDIGGLVKFTARMIHHMLNPPFENREMVKQSYFIGYKTLPLIAVTAFILGLVITLQSRPVLAGF